MNAMSYEERMLLAKAIATTLRDYELRQLASLENAISSLKHSLNEALRDSEKLVVDTVFKHEAKLPDVPDGLVTYESERTVE